MGKSDDRDHFEDYREQTRVKHEILAAYLPAYFRILGKGYDKLLYIDGFAGRGTYTQQGTGQTVDGSPLKALKLIGSNPTFAQRVRTIFIEWDGELFDPMNEAVTAYFAANQHIHEPITHNGTFADGIQTLMEATKGRLPPTFLFVDPCGVSGTCFESIRKVMACQSCEAFIFFNVDGVRRVAGLDKLSDVLVELLGSDLRAARLYAALRAERDTYKREQMILACYREALRDDMGALFTIPFRVESEDKQKTSHYLIHACKNPLGFKIMKDVMWKLGHSDDGGSALEFAQASRTNYIPIFPRDYNTRQEILQAIANGPKCVDVFCKEWPLRPEDLMASAGYQHALKELEREGQIEILDKDGTTPKPATKRMRGGKVTLGEGYYVRKRV